MKKTMMIKAKINLQKKCESKDNDGECNGDDENTEILNQKIILSIRDIIKDTCYLEYKHIWQDWVTVGRINNLELLKIKSLNNLLGLVTTSTVWVTACVNVLPTRKIIFNTK